MNQIFQEDLFAIFGARGMAGSAISRALQRAGYHQQLNPSSEELDLLDSVAVKNWFAENNPTVVVLAAATVGGIHANATYPAKFLLNNLKIQTNVIESAWRSGVRRLLFLGSSCIYPKFSSQPIKEESLLSGGLEPTNEWYAIAKISGLKLCEALRREHGFDALTLMPTNLYGPRDNYHSENSHVLPAMIHRFNQAVESKQQTVTCWGSGSPLREFLHVDDLGEASVFILQNWRPDVDELAYLNVGTGFEISILELAKKVAAVTGFSGSICWDISRPDGTPRKLLDVSRIKDLGWSPKISLDEGLIDTFKAYREELQSKKVRFH